MTTELKPCQLAELFNYDPDTGVLTWRIAPGNRIAKDTPCGSLDSNGRLRLEYRGRSYGVHKIAFAIAHGRWPVGQVDHKNRIKTDNRPGNLREATNAQNSRNRRNGKNATGYKGVTFHKRQRKYNARIMVDGRSISLGSFSDPKAAANAYNVAARQHHGEFALLNEVGAE